MEASKDLSLASWVTDINLLKEYLDTGYVERSIVNSFVMPECAEEVYRGLNQFYFWTRKLQASSNVLVNSLTFLGPSGLSKPDVAAIQDILYSSLGPGCIVELNYSENSNFISFAMVSPEAAKRMRELVVEVGGALVCYISARPHNAFRARILWAPLAYPIDGITSALSKWCESTDLNFDKMLFKNGEVVPTNRASGTITLKLGLNPLDLPHIIQLPNTVNSNVLLIIRERPPICLRCRTVGHIRKFCDNVKCRSCGSLHRRSDNCPSKSYATVTASFLGSASPGILNNDISTVPSSSSKVLDNTISFCDHSSFATNDKGVSVSLQTKDPQVDTSHTHDGFQLVTRRVTRSMVKQVHNLKHDVPLNDAKNTAHYTGLFSNLVDEAEIIGTDTSSEDEPSTYALDPLSHEGLSLSTSSLRSTKCSGMTGSRQQNKRFRQGRKRAKLSCANENIILSVPDNSVITAPSCEGESEILYQDGCKKSNITSWASEVEVSLECLNEKEKEKTIEDTIKNTSKDDSAARSCDRTSEIFHKDECKNSSVISCAMEVLDDLSHECLKDKENKKTFADITKNTESINHTISLDGLTEEIINNPDEDTLDSLQTGSFTSIYLEGFPIDMDLKKIKTFLGNIYFKKWVAYADDDDVFDGSFSVQLRTEKDLDKALSMDGSFFEGNCISVKEN